MRQFTSIACSAVALIRLILPVATASQAPLVSPAHGVPSTNLSVNSHEFNISSYWGNMSPYENAHSFGVPRGMPRGCELSQVHVLHRHAERYPAGIMPSNFSTKLAAYKRRHPGSNVGTGPLEFLNRWEELLGAETLLPTGSSTEATSGANFWRKYGRLLYRAGADVARWDKSLNVFPNGTARPKPSFRANSGERIIESARWWLSGFFSNSDGNGSHDQYRLVVIPAKTGVNNTLAPFYVCDYRFGAVFKSLGQWLATANREPAARLSAYLPANFNLTTSDVFDMQQLCAYEWTTFSGSKFCALFTDQDWRNFEYALDIQFYAIAGFGAPIGRAHGIGYVEELVARLEKRLITETDTGINTDYDKSEETFPLGQPFYLDMSHDTVLIPVLTALGIRHFRYGPHGLPGNVPQVPPHTFNLNQVTPFGARIVSEVWKCPCEGTQFQDLDPVVYKNPDFSNNQTCTKDYIRFLLNDAPLPLEGMPLCEDSAENGFCPVTDFIKALPELKKKATYQWACHGNYSTPDQVSDGRPEQPPPA